jgi:hypothetical protein
LDNPRTSDTPTQGDDEIRALRAAIQERIKNEHTTYDADATGGVAALDWLHKAGSSISYYLPTESAPTVGLSGSPLKNGALWYDTTLDVLKVWVGSGWTVVALNVMQGASRASLASLGATGLYTKVLTLNWPIFDIAASAAHGLDVTKIRSISVTPPSGRTLDKIAVDATNVHAYINLVVGTGTGYAVVHYVP